MDVSDSKQQMLNKVGRFFPDEEMHFKVKATYIIRNTWSEETVATLLRMSEVSQSAALRFAVDGSVKPATKTDAGNSPIKHACSSISRWFGRSSHGKSQVGRCT